MKIYYMNDEKHTVVVQVNHQLQPSNTNPYGDIKVDYFKLQPCESKTFYVDAPADSIPYVKKWPNQVLLTYLPAEAQVEDQASSDKSQA